MKQYYPIEEAINNVSKRFRLGFKDADEMDEIELEIAEVAISKYVVFVSHPDFIQLVPQVRATGELILSN